MQYKSNTPNNIPPHKDPILWISVVMLILFFIFLGNACHAQKAEVRYDTVSCNIEYIDEFIEVPTASGKTVRRFAVYNDKYHDISEIISVSKSVYEYIEMCKQHNIKPSLGIKLKNGVIVSIIRYKPKYIKRKSNEKR